MRHVKQTNKHVFLSVYLSLCLSYLSPPALPPKKRRSLPGPSPCRVAIVAPMRRVSDIGTQVQQVHSWDSFNSKFMHDGKHIQVATVTVISSLCKMNKLIFIKTGSTCCKYWCVCLCYRSLKMMTIWSDTLHLLQTLLLTTHTVVTHTHTHTFAALVEGVEWIHFLSVVTLIGVADMHFL